MATQESSADRAPVRTPFIAVAFYYLAYLFLFAVCGTALFLAWPTIQARLSGGATTTIDALPTPRIVPTMAPAPPPVPAPVIVQSVPQGAAPQSITIATPVVPTADQGSNVAPPAPAPVVIVLHENDTHGAPIVTGSGACAVAAKGARRCGK